MPDRCKNARRAGGVEFACLESSLTCLHRTSALAGPSLGQERNSSAPLGGRYQAVQKKLRDWARGRVSVWRKALKFLPTKTRDCVSLFIINSKDLNSSECKTTVSRRKE